MDNITRPLTQRLTRRLVFDLELLHYDSGTGGGVPFGALLINGEPLVVETARNYLIVGNVQ